MKKQFPAIIAACLAVSACTDRGGSPPVANAMTAEQVAAAEKFERDKAERRAELDLERFKECRALSEKLIQDGLIAGSAQGSDRSMIVFVSDEWLTLPPDLQRDIGECFAVGVSGAPGKTTNLTFATKRNQRAVGQVENGSYRVILQ